MIKWDHECQEAFVNLKELCTSTPILAYADFKKPFRIHKDARILGLGAVLYQEHNGVETVLSYASHSLSKSESKYPVHKLEFLYLKWAITDQFHEYLYGNTFDVYTDNSPLTYVLSTGKLDAMGHRWIASLANYNYCIHYRPGKGKSEAIALSRIDWEKYDKTIGTESIQAVVAAATIVDSDHLAPATRLLENELNPKCMTIQDWVEAQSKDKIISEIVQLFKSRNLRCHKLNENEKKLDEIIHQTM